MASINKSKIAESAQKFLAKGQIDKALKEYERILQADPGDSSTRLKVGDLRQKIGQKDQAIADYRRVADKFTADGFYSKAVAVWKRIIAVDAQILEAHLELADLNQKLGLLSEVVHHYQLAANIHDRRAEKHQAIDILKKVADIGPPNLERKIKVAELYYREGLQESGFKQFQETISELDPQSPDLPGLARRMCKASPDDPRLRHRLGELLLARGDAKGAADALIEAEGRARDAAVVELLGEAHFKLEQLPHAAKCFTEARDLHSAAGNTARAQALAARLVEIQAEAFDAGAPGAEPPPPERSTAADAPDRSEDAGAGKTSEVPADDFGEPAPGRANAELSEDESLEAALSEADVYQKYGKHDRAVTILEELAARYPHRHEAPLRLRTIFEGCEDWMSVAIQCRRLAAVAEGRGDPERAARYQEQALEAELRAAGKPVDPEETLLSSPDAAPVAMPPAREVVLAESPVAEAALPDVPPPASAPEPDGFGEIELVIEEEESLAKPEPDLAPEPESEDLRAGADQSLSIDAEPLAPPEVTLERESGPDELSAGELEIDLDREPSVFVPGKVFVPGVPTASRSDAGASGDDLDLRLEEEPPVPARAPWAPAPGAPPGPGEQETSEIDLELRAEELGSRLEPASGELTAFEPGADLSPETHDLTDSGEAPLGNELAPAQGRSLEEELILEEIAAEEGRDDADAGGPPRSGGRQVSSDRSSSPEGSEGLGEFGDFSSTPPDPGPDLEEAEFYASQGMLAEAIGLYERAVEARPDEDAPRERLAELVAMAGSSFKRDLPEAIALVDEAPALVGAHTAPEASGDRQWSLDDPSPIAADSARDFPTDLPDGAASISAETASAAMEAPAPEPDGVWDESVFLDEESAIPPPASGERDLWALPSSERSSTSEDLGRGTSGLERRNKPFDESGFDLRAELDDAMPADIGGVTQATEALSELVSELQIREEAEGATHDAQTHYDLGIAYKEMGLLDDAIRELRIASRDDGRRVDCFTVLGICYLELGKPEEALGLFEQALSHGSVAGTVAAGILYEMGMAHESAGNAAGALECYKRVAAIDPAYREIAERLARLSADSEPPKPKRGRKKKISYL